MVPVGFFPVKKCAGWRAGNEPEREATGPGPPATGTLRTTAGLGAPVGAFVPAPCNSRAESRMAGEEGGEWRPSCRRRGDPGGSRSGGKETGPPEREAAGARGARAKSWGACGLRSASLVPVPHVPVTPGLLRAPAAAAPASPSWHSDRAAVPAPKRWLVPRVGGGGEGNVKRFKINQSQIWQ